MNAEWISATASVLNAALTTGQLLFPEKENKAVCVVLFAIAVALIVCGGDKQNAQSPVVPVAAAPMPVSAPTSATAQHVDPSKQVRDITERIDRINDDLRDMVADIRQVLSKRK